jgi:hypothetical protein
LFKPNRGERTRTSNPRFWRPVLCQLSYAPGSEWRIVLPPPSSLARVRAPSQRRALGVLFALLTALFVLIAVAALGAREWIVGVAAAALALWVGGLALRSLASR